MWTFLKAAYYLCILIFGFISLTGTAPPQSKSKQFSDIQLTEQGLKWKEKEYDQKLAVGLQPCSYELKFTSKYKNMKEPQPFTKEFFHTNNLDMNLIATCLETYMPEEILEDLEDLMLNYDDLTPEQKLIVDYRVETGYYKSIVIAEEKFSYAKFNDFLWYYGRVTYFAFIINTLVAFLYRRLVIREQEAENEQ